MKLHILLPLLVAAAILYLLAWPVPIDPAAWEPPEAPSTTEGVHAVNNHLAVLERIAEGVGRGPEAIAIDDEGRLLTGFEDGRVMRFDADGGNGELLANTGGRPLGLHALSDGSVIVADAVEGLMRISDGYAYTLSVSAEGTPYRFVDDVVVDAEERIAYFTDASSRFGVHEVMADAFEHRPHGRVLAYDLKTDEVTVLAEDLYFANGITLGPEEEYLVFTETTRYRVQKLWLEGERAGDTEVLIDNLPGFPDNITFNGEDRFWLAIYSPREPMLDALLEWPFLRKIAYRLPEFLQPGPSRHAYVLALSPEGDVLADLQHVGEDAYAPITSAIEHEGRLYLGSLSAPAIGRVALDALPLDEAGEEGEAPEAD
jgi:sugar lactone lactonase YvrE